MPLRYRTIGSSISAWKFGHTLNASTNGILVEVSERAPVGSTVELVIEWPGLYFDREMVHLIVIAHVARIDGRGTALRILSHRFCEMGPMAAGLRKRQENRAVA